MANAKPRHPMIGYGLLTYDFEDGMSVVQWQGEIAEVVQTNSSVGDIAIVEWFEWLSGGYTHSSAVPLSRMAIPYGVNGYIRLFPNSKSRNEYYETHGRHHQSKKVASYVQG